MVSVIVQSTKLVRSPMVSSLSMTSFPPKYRIIKMRTFANIVVIRSIIPQKKSFLRPVLYTLSNKPEQFRLSRFQLENERTTRMLPKTSVASEVVKAKLFEYCFCNFFIFFITINTPKDMIGVSTIMTRVSFQLINHKNNKLPKNCKKFRSSIDRLSEHTEQTVVMSLPNRLRSYPVLFWSQQEISLSRSLSKSSCLISTIIFSPNKLNEYPLMAEKMAIKMVKMINLIVPSMRSPAYLIVSTICPQSKGKRVKPPEDMISATLATINICLFFHEYPNNLLKVFMACLAFLFDLSDVSCYMRVDRVRLSLWLFNSLSSPSESQCVISLLSS